MTEDTGKDILEGEAPAAENSPAEGETPAVRETPVKEELSGGRETRTRNFAEEERKNGNHLYRWFNFLRVIEFCILRPLMPYKKHGAVRKYNDGAYITVGNHHSIFDVMYPPMITDRGVHCVAKKELWDGHVWKFLCNTSEAIKVNRDGNDVKAVFEIMKVLKAGGIVNIFPEGTRNRRDDCLLPFKGGFSAIAIKTRTPIIPFCIVYKRRNFRMNHVIYGEPIEFREYYGKKVTDEISNRCDEYVKDVIWKMRCDFLAEQEAKKVARKHRKGKDGTLSSGRETT